MNKRLTLEFGNLPLVEATMRATLANPVPLTFNSINETHKELAAEFRTIDQPNAIEAPPGVQESTFIIGPGQIPGVVLTGNDKGLSVSIYSQVIVARWLKLPNGPTYPRYESLSDALWKVKDSFCRASGVSTSVIVVNMSYTNFVPSASEGSFIKEYFSDIAQIQLTQNAKQITKFEVAWQDDSEVDLRVDLNRVALRLGPNQLEGFRLLTVAGMKVPQSETPNLILDQVHNRLQYFFRDLISERAKNEWVLQAQHA